ncbi:cytochrome c oxidase subunit 7C, mitochondrial-like [Lycorma delicatula]|uniref:cytochrome c oxidase subunit 7C, mitochondrial-like n=1 Tax=Lycorma delicatula TaxID=130591 RepID=UPI003F51460B
MVLPRLSAFARHFTTSAVRRSHYNGGVPGENLPFDTNNLPKFTIFFGLFLASGLSLPFLIVRHQLLKH